MPHPRVFIPQSSDEAEGLLEDGAGSVVVFLGDAQTDAGRACVAALASLASEFDPDQIIFAHVDPRQLREAQELFPCTRLPAVLSCRDGEVLDATVGRQCGLRLRRQVQRLLRDDPGPSLLTRLFRFASGA